jgi:type VI secretion system protein VasI
VACNQITIIGDLRCQLTAVCVHTVADRFEDDALDFIEQGTSVYIERNGKPMDFAGRVAALTYSADGKTRSTRSFLSSSDSRAIGLWNGPDAISFVNELHGGTTLRVEAKPAGSPGYKSDFKIDRLDEAIAAAQSACHW